MNLTIFDKNECSNGTSSFSEDGHHTPFMASKYLGPELYQWMEWDTLFSDKESCRFCPWHLVFGWLVVWNIFYFP
jgi:hypothetical protein